MGKKIPCPAHPEFELDEDAPMPGLNLGVEFDGPTSESWDDLIAEITFLRTLVVGLKASGAVLCSRDGRHVFYHEPTQQGG